MATARLIALALVAGGLLPASAGAATLTVNDTGDTVAEDGICTLREGITAANTNTESGDGVGGAPECVAGQASPVGDTIEFSMAGAGPHVISPSSALPPITEVATVDGSTEPDEVRLDGNVAGGATGLDVDADGVTADTLTVVRFGNGIDLSGTADAIVRDSFIGTTPSGTAGLGNTDGILAGTGASPTTDAEIRDNVISGNATEGVTLNSDGSTGNVIAGNRIGTTPGGAAALANGQEGIEIIGGADANTIGGTGGFDGNLISGNGSGAIRVFTTSVRATGNVIEGNRIGTRIGGEQALGNGGTGISLQGPVDTTEVRDNLVSGNTGFGIRVEDSALQPVGAAGPTSTIISGNLVGTDKDGEAAIGNSAGGIALFGTNRVTQGTEIGGTAGLTPGGACTGDCNVIAASSGGNARGIELREGVGTRVLGNHIGVDLAGTADLGNAGWGISGEDIVDSEIGAPGAGNVVSGNALDGIVVFGPAATGNTVQANLVGLGSDALTPLGNGQHGIAFQSSAAANLAGGTGADQGNVVANNVLDGVQVALGATDNAILGNSIQGNNGLGIDLGTSGVNANDPGDADVGDNDLQNFPELAAAVAGSSTVIAGRLESEPSTTYLIEAFSNSTADGSGNGEGEVPLGGFSVTTDAGGEAPFAATVAGTAGAGGLVSATATELDGSGNPLSTSEFAANVTEGCDVTGSPGDDPNLSGTGGDDVICGLGGDDVIDGGGGDDVIVGGTGTDELDYSGAAGAIDADLVTGVIAGAGAGSDLVAEVEDVTGTDFDDEMLAGDEENTLDGGDGEDTLESGDGDDTLKGRDGKDTLIAKSDKDKLRGGDGGDDLQGGGGDKDDLDGDDGKDTFDGGGGDKDDCDGGPDKDHTPAPDCEKKRSIP